MANKLGPTGDYPEGKLNKTDEGGLRIAITSGDNVVLINLGKKISWFGMSKEAALEFADTILKHAETL